MKKIFLLCLGGCYLIQLFSQGNFNIANGIRLKTSTGVNLVLNDLHLVNNGLLQQNIGDGIIKFTGNTNVNLSGSGLTIDQLILSKGSGSEIKLLTNVTIISEVNFQGGLLNLGQSQILLGNTGILTNESENSRAYTNDEGYIVAVRVLNSPSMVNMGNLGAVISSTKNLGTTSVYRGHKAQQNIYGTNNSILRNYLILPANNTALKATLRFFYFDAELNGIDEANLIQWKMKNPTTWDYVGADSKDLTANYVERQNISKFARWTLAPDIISALTRAFNNPEPEDNKKEFSIIVMPNPTINSFSVMVKSDEEAERIMIRVIDVSGRIREVKSNIISGEIFTLGTNYQSGTYLVEAIQGNKRKVVKLIKL